MPVARINGRETRHLGRVLYVRRIASRERFVVRDDASRRGAAQRRRPDASTRHSRCAMRDDGVFKDVPAPRRDRRVAARVCGHRGRRCWSRSRRTAGRIMTPRLPRAWRSQKARRRGRERPAPRRFRRFRRPVLSRRAAPTRPRRRGSSTRCVADPARPENKGEMATVTKYVAGAGGGVRDRRLGTWSGAAEEARARSAEGVLDTPGGAPGGAGRSRAGTR